MSIEQIARRFVARSRLPDFERQLFDLIASGKKLTLREYAQAMQSNTRRTHMAMDYLESNGYIYCPSDKRGRRAAYEIND